MRIGEERRVRRADEILVDTISEMVRHATAVERAREAMRKAAAANDGPALHEATIAWLDTMRDPETTAIDPGATPSTTTSPDERRRRSAIRAAMARKAKARRDGHGVADAMRSLRG